MVGGWWVLADKEAMRQHYAAMLPFLAMFGGAAVVLGLALGLAWAGRCGARWRSPWRR